MSLVTNAKNVGSASAFSTDKICAMLVGAYNAANYNTILGGFLYQYTIPHPFGRPLFCDALFSNDGGNTYTPNGQPLNDGSTSLQVYSDASNIYILNLTNTGTINYKIVGTWIDNYDTTNPLVTPIFNTNSSKAYYDSRQNYQKLLTPPSGEIVLENPGTGNTGTQITVHNLKYAPNYKIYFESLPNQVWPCINGGAQDQWLYDSANQYQITPVMNTTNLNLSYIGGSTSAPTFRVWQKVYYDGEL